MFYRIKIDLAFDDIDACEDILDKALDHLYKAHTINPGTENVERGFISVVECHHDENPNEPCTLIEEHFTD